MSGSSVNGRLRQWLIQQVDTAKYPGLVWENEEKSIFRIPWKHAGKQDYNREEDAALFKAWALFKGKHREGIDKPDPPTWKTRLRCALNKSNDFEELSERSQLDISDPFKVYRIIPEGVKKGSRSPEDSPSNVRPLSHPLHQHYAQLQSQMCNFLSPCERSIRDFLSDKSSFSEVRYSQNLYTPCWDPGYQITGSFYSCGVSDPPSSPFTLDSSLRSAEAIALSGDCRLQVSVFFRDSLVQEVTVMNTEGCRLVSSDEAEQGHRVPGTPELVPLPQDELGGLERGVLLWMAADGLYARRYCPRRVFWDGPHTDKPNTLEQEQSSKLLDTQLLITALQAYALHTRPPPLSRVLLMFEDECQDPQRQRSSLTVQVEPLFARQLLFLAQQSGVNFIRGQELPPLSLNHAIPPNQDYHRVITHPNSNALLE